MLGKIKKYLYKFYSFYFKKNAYSTLFLNITSFCNSNCAYCEVKNLDHSKDMSFERIIKLIKEAKQIGINHVYLSGGEPFVYPEIFKVLKQAKKSGMRLSMISNGLAIKNFNKEQLEIIKNCIDYIGISLDSADPKTHDSLRGIPGAFESTVQGIKILKQIGKNPVIYGVISNKNYNELDKLILLADKLGVREMVFQPFHIWTNYSEVKAREDKKNLLISEDYLKDIKPIMKKAVKLSKKIKVKTNLPVIYPWIDKYFQSQGEKFNKNKLWFLNIIKDYRCVEPFTTLFIHSDGGIQPCAMIRQITNIKDKSLIDGIKDMENFKQMIKQRKFPSACQACSCQVATNYLFSVLNSPIRNMGKFIQLFKDLYL